MFFTILKKYSRLPFFVRLHLYIRWLICPFIFLSDKLATVTDLLDIGCGHGLFAQLVSWRYPKIKILGIDISSSKIAIAQRSTTGTVSFSCSTIEQLTQTYSAISMLDVLYLISPQERQGFMQKITALLQNDGELLIKEVVRCDVIWKNVWAILQEFLAIYILRLTQGRLYALPDISELKEIITNSGLSIEECGFIPGYIHAHYYIKAKKS